MIGNKWDKRFFFCTGVEGTFVPDLLLQNFRQMGMNDSELVFTLQLLMLNKKGNLNVTEIAESLVLDIDQVQQNLAVLIEKGFIVMDTDPVNKENPPHYFFDGLYDKLIDVWAVKMVTKSEVALTSQHQVSTKSEFGEVFTIIEGEFGRPLTTIENDKIKEWFNPLGYTVELVLEALKRAVLRGVYNLNYIDRILLDWQKANVRTLQEALNYEKQKMSRGKKSTKKSSYVKKQGSDLDDLYEL